MQALPPYLAPQSGEQTTGYSLPFRVYHTKAWRYMWVVLPITWLSFLASLVSRAWNHDRFGIVLGCGAVIFYTFFAWFFDSIRLVISPEGVTYQSAGSTLFAPWQVLAHTERDTLRVQGGIWQHVRVNVLMRRAKAEIPLRGTFGAFWERGAYEALGAYAPWLFEGR